MKRNATAKSKSEITSHRDAWIFETSCWRCGSVWCVACNCYTPCRTLQIIRINCWSTPLRQPRVTTRAQDRHIRTSHLRNRFLTVTITAAATRGRNNNKSSVQTVRRRLAEYGIRARHLYMDQSLPDVIDATGHSGYVSTFVGINNSGTRCCLATIQGFFSKSKDGRVMVYRRRGERFADACVRQVDRYGGGSIMIWDAIFFHHLSRLVVMRGNLTGVRYQDEILAPVVVPLMNANRRLTVFQQDNARCHTARVCADYLQ